jgi:hypothetical protein
MSTDLKVAIHHLIPREMLKEFGADMNTLFGGADNNPYRTDAVGNTVALPSQTGFGDALGSLPVNSLGFSFFTSIGLGEQLHRFDEFHKSYNDFVRDQLEDIFENEPDPAAQKARSHSLTEFARAAAQSGVPPFDSTTDVGWTSAYNDFMRNTCPFTSRSFLTNCHVTSTSLTVLNLSGPGRQNLNPGLRILGLDCNGASGRALDESATPIKVVQHDPASHRLSFTDRRQSTNGRGGSFGGAGRGENDPQVRSGCTARRYA